MSEQPQQPSQPPGYGYPNQAPGAADKAGPYGYPQGGPQQTPGGYQQPGYQQPGYQQPPGGYQTPGYQQAPGYYGGGDPNALYGYDPYGRPYSEKSKIVAGVLQLFLGSFGIGRFYVGNVGMGIAQLFTCGGLGIWALVDAIMYLVSNDRTDAQGRILRG
ncbi:MULTISPECIES: NINE protein [unclassified Streptomyces]|uniref:TM2 domain-containing protein n=1 Tax=unclassified Streptomyces TaxID=2593676 RepID=UPI00331D32CB